MSHVKPDQLSHISIKGYKSIKECDLELRDINVLIGSNGAGKSNFISVFSLLQSISLQEQNFYAQIKGLNTLFYNGIKHTPNIFLKFF